MIDHLYWAPNIETELPGSLTEDLILRAVRAALRRNKERMQASLKFAEDQKLAYYFRNPFLAFLVYTITPMNLLYLGFLAGPDADGGELHWQWCFWRGSRAARQLWA